MNKRLVWAASTLAIVLALMLISCGGAGAPSTTTPQGITTSPQVTTPPAPPTQQISVAPTIADKPKYGGTFTRVLTSEPSFDFYSTSFAPNLVFVSTNEGMVFGDWTKGPAGGFGTGETDWGRGYDVLGLKKGLAAESWSWSVDAAKDEATLVYKIRSDIHYALNPNSEASRLVNGREMTPDDVVFTMRQVISDTRMYVYSGVPELRVAKIDKTGPWEVTVKVPVASLMTAFQRLSYWSRVVPKEAIDKYGSMADWRNNVGTGPFMIIDYVSGSSVLLQRNSKYWMSNPVGPGKGDQLPYVDRARYLIIVDASTRYAALRTGKIDQITDIALDDAEQARRASPQLKEIRQAEAGTGARWMRVDKPPTNDIRVRKAMMMATDFKAINSGLYRGLGTIQTYPFPLQKGYERLVLSIDDPKMPQEVKDLYTYNPEKAKLLLKEAGYPNGFKIEALMTEPEVDYYSVLKDQWSKVGVELGFQIREPASVTNILRSGAHPNIAVSGVSMNYHYYYMPHLTATQGVGNPSMINDPFIVDSLKKVKTVLITDEKAAMDMWGGTDGLYVYVLKQAFAIPTVGPPTYAFWWPWVKNYSGELWLGEALNHQAEWYRYIWIDQEMKRSMGY